MPCQCQVIIRCLDDFVKLNNCIIHQSSANDDTFSDHWCALFETPTVVQSNLKSHSQLIHIAQIISESANNGLM